MEAVETLAQSLSTYGLYTIIAILCFVIVHLYRRVNALEKEVRDAISKSASEAKTVATETAKLLSQTLQTIETNTKSLDSIQTLITEIRTEYRFSRLEDSEHWRDRNE